MYWFEWFEKIRSIKLRSNLVERDLEANKTIGLAVITQNLQHQGPAATGGQNEFRDDWHTNRVYRQAMQAGLQMQ